MRKLLTFLCLILFTTASQAQFTTEAGLLNQVYGSVGGCTQVSVTTTGHNRSAAQTVGRRVVVYGYNAADISAGDAIRCAWGGSTVDVTALSGSRVGIIIPVGQNRVFFVKTGAEYISCISKTATMKYDICPLD